MKSEQWIFITSRLEAKKKPQIYISNCGYFRVFNFVCVVLSLPSVSLRFDSGKHRHSQGNDLISVQHKETQMTASSMPCFCATEGINYKNAFNRSGKSGVLHCVYGPGPNSKLSRSIPPSLLPAIISSSSEIPLLFGIGFT